MKTIQVETVDSKTMDLKVGLNTKFDKNVVFRSFEDLPITFGSNCLIRAGVVIYGGCEFGDKVQIGCNTVIRERLKVGSETYLGTLCAFEGDTIIGNGVGIHSQNHITKFCKLGDYTFIAPLFCGANDNAMTHRRSGHGENLIGFETGEGVRIAIGVMVLPGVKIGKHSIIGAHAMVTKDIPDYSLAVGSPAKVLKTIKEDPIIHKVIIE